MHIRHRTLATSMPWRYWLLPGFTLATAVLAGPAAANDFNTRSLEAGYARIVAFEAEPEIAAGSFVYDDDDPALGDLEIRSGKIPWFKALEADEAGCRWFVQITANYLNVNQEGDLLVEGVPTSQIDLEMSGYGLMGEGGRLLPVLPNLDLAISFGAGVTRLENTLDFSSALIEEILRPVADGVLYNWDTWAGVGRGSVALRYDNQHGNWRFKTSASLSGSYIDSFNESSRFDGFSDEAGSFALKLDASHPLGVAIRDHPLRLIGHLGYTEFLGGNRDELGFVRFGEAGMSVGMDRYALGVQAVLGEELSGWNITFNYGY